MAIFHDKKSNKSYSGAGVIVIENYYKNNKTIPCFVIARNKASKQYSDFGGSYEKKHKNIAYTARFELLEESANLLNIPINHFTRRNSFDLNASSTGIQKYYKVFVIKINGIARKYFNHNINTITKQHAPHQWKETDDIAHIPITNIDIIAINKRGIVTLKDVDGRIITIAGRLKGILRHLTEKLTYNNKFVFNINRTQNITPIEFNQKPVATRSDLKRIQSSNFLNNTLSLSP